MQDIENAFENLLKYARQVKNYCKETEYIYDENSEGKCVDCALGKDPYFCKAINTFADGVAPEDWRLE